MSSASTHCLVYRAVLICDDARSQLGVVRRHELVGDQLRLDDSLQVHASHSNVCRSATLNPLALASGPQPFLLALREWLFLPPPATSSARDFSSPPRCRQSFRHWFTRCTVRCTMAGGGAKRRGPLLFGTDYRSSTKPLGSPAVAKLGLSCGEDINRSLRVCLYY